MNLDVPELELVQGRTICLHIPHGFHKAGEALQDELLELGRHQSRIVSVAWPAGFEHGAADLSPNEGSASWLSRVAGISEAQASQIIAGLGIRVAEKMGQNAGTPRSLLGIAAKLVKEPEVIVYSTMALDFEGCRMVHRFVASKCSRMCVVHVSYPSVYGDGTPHPRDCPAGAACVELAAAP